MNTIQAIFEAWQHDHQQPTGAQLAQALKEYERLQAIEAAAKNLVKVKGRYHTEQAFKALQQELEK